MMEYTKEDVQKHLLSILVRDFRYDHLPMYGWYPLRHQHAWTLATEGMEPSDVERFIEEEKGEYEREKMQEWKHRELES